MYTCDNEFFFPFLNLVVVPKNSTSKKFAYICHFQQIEINATKFRKMRTHFKSDVFAAIIIVDAKLILTYLEGGKG